MRMARCEQASRVLWRCGWQGRRGSRLRAARSACVPVSISRSGSRLAIVRRAQSSSCSPVVLLLGRAGRVPGATWRGEQQLTVLMLLLPWVGALAGHRSLCGVRQTGRTPCIHAAPRARLSAASGRWQWPRRAQAGARCKGATLARLLAACAGTRGTCGRSSTSASSAPTSRARRSSCPCPGPNRPTTCRQRASPRQQVHTRRSPPLTVTARASSRP